MAKERSDAYYFASQTRLTLRRFWRHRVAVVALFVLGALYLAAIFAGFLAPYTADYSFKRQLNVPPAKIHWSGLRPFIHPLLISRDPETLAIKTDEDRSRRHYLRFFVRGQEYRMLGLRATVHLVGVDDPKVPLFFLGSDRLGRDIFSRIVYGSRISLTIGLVGVALSFLLGLVIGGVSGYFGGLADAVIQRSIDFLISIPSLPLWMVLSGLLPHTWSSTQTYFAITVVLSVVGWCGLARVVRGKLLSIRNEDFVTAAIAMGARRSYVIFRHMIPSFSGYLIVSLTLAIPGMILGETALSFIGLGMQPPAVSWGVMLKDAQNLLTVALYPWNLFPALLVVATVLAFNFLGDGIRDAVDPYSR